ncbi:MAG: hypothetical protein HOC77_11935 [Chloroflexi bacterium]|nr:hypothetical protein [Chloroflexota bacterium]MBT4072466.1 hypothetical protein [Chloroflexota bacterium]MBT4515786.1 hypothetical protein [Chloroflexota bacterium]MBT6682947.1 hypothetical protein [Chloroflexota bacterium]
MKSQAAQENAQRGITGLETAIVLIAFVVVSSVFAFTVLTTGIFSSERSKQTVFAGLDEVRSSLHPKGSVIAYKGALDGSTDTIYKVSFVVSSAVDGDQIDLTPPYDVGSDGDDPDIVSGARTKTVISYSDSDQFLSDLPWTVSWPGADNGDNVLDSGEAAEITVWMADRVTGVSSASDAGGIALMDGTATDGGTGGFADTSTVPGVDETWTIEVKSDRGATLSIERTLPSALKAIMDLR